MSAGRLKWANSAASSASRKLLFVLISKTSTNGDSCAELTAAPFASLQVKASLREGEKQRIGAAAAALIKDGDSIILDSGTTTQQIAKQIKSRKDLTVITNGINIAMELLGAKDV